MNFIKFNDIKRRLVFLLIVLMTIILVPVNTVYAETCSEDDCYEWDETSKVLTIKSDKINGSWNNEHYKERIKEAETIIFNPQDGTFKIETGRAFAEIEDDNGRHNLKSVIFNCNVKLCDGNFDRVLADNRNLEEVTFKKNLEIDSTCNEGLFSGCYNLKSVIFDENSNVSNIDEEESDIFGDDAFELVGLPMQEISSVEVVDFLITKNFNYTDDAFINFLMDEGIISNANDPLFSRLSFLAGEMKEVYELIDDEEITSLNDATNNDYIKRILTNAWYRAAVREFGTPCTITLPSTWTYNLPKNGQCEGGYVIYEGDESYRLIKEATDKMGNYRYQYDDENEKLETNQSPLVFEAGSGIADILFRNIVIDNDYGLSLISMLDFSLNERSSDTLSLKAYFDIEEFKIFDITFKIKNDVVSQFTIEYGDYEPTEYGGYLEEFLETFSGSLLLEGTYKITSVIPELDPPSNPPSNPSSGSPATDTPTESAMEVSGYKAPNTCVR